MKSINTSGHKFGLAPLGVGWVIWRDAAELPEELIFNVNYLGGNMPTFALNFSRPGGQIVAQYYNFLRLGREGYRKIHQAGYDNAQYLAEAIGKLGPFELIYDGRGGIPALAWKLRGGHRPRLHPLRPRRSATDNRLAGARLHTAEESRRSRHPTHSRAPRLQPRPGRSPTRRLQTGAPAPRQAPDHELTYRRGSRHLQSQLTSRLHGARVG